MRLPIVFSHCVTNQQRTSLNVCYSPTLQSLTPVADRPSQGTSCKRNSGRGSLPQILLSTIIPHIKLSTVGLRHGLSKATHSENGSRAVRYYGSVAIVCISHRFYLSDINPFPNFAAGAGKSVLWYALVLFSFRDTQFLLSTSSAIIEDVKNMREASSTLIAYYYFDFKDGSKRGLHGLLASVLFQLGDDDEHCRDILYQLCKTCRDGSEQPSDAALVKCLETILDLPGQLPIFIIIDALDECPSNTGTPSAREEVLDFVENLVGSNRSNLSLCITSRPEQDIQTVLNPLTSAPYRVSLHEEVGQWEDINSYVQSFVHKDRTMRRWREEDRELVITTLSKRAHGM